ncbi:hypothetical protein [Methylobacterium longum]|uniref:Uncharacterized protein n=1 Tax=Methylobacterium longum TaxID=767694 RepID=A0ABT8ALT0_9HYPH|nr:hypothetical protein [Methylobacterium longum]MDN3570862.1 hypothetical protein [Methylobacterium longum]GJE14356.1 hypothetical protein FOHLNKBM_5431 [Methylobacterium longum]
MPGYRLRGAVRSEDGAIGDPLVDEVLSAADAKEAVRLANSRSLTIEDDTINALWLVDAGGTLLWSLRRADRDS